MPAVRLRFGARPPRRPVLTARRQRPHYASDVAQAHSLLERGALWRKTFDCGTCGSPLLEQPERTRDGIDSQVRVGVWSAPAWRWAAASGGTRPATMPVVESGVHALDIGLAGVTAASSFSTVAWLPGECTKEYP